MEEDRYIRITLRLPRELHARLDAAADDTSKSLNAEIVGRLEASFRGDEIPLTQSLLDELRRTQIALNLNRAEAEVRDAKNRKEVAGVELGHLKDVNADPAAIKRGTMVFQVAHADLMEAIDRLDGLKHHVRVNEPGLLEAWEPSAQPGNIERKKISLSTNEPGTIAVQVRKKRTFSPGDGKP